MTNFSRSEFVRGLLCVSAATALSVPRRAFANTFTLSIGHVLEPQHSVHIGALKFKEVAEAKSNNQLKVNLFPASILGGSRELALQMQSGSIFGVIDATTKFGNFVPEYTLLDLPFLANDANAAFKVMDSAAASELIYEKSIKAGYRPVHGWEVGFRNIYTRNRTINELKDVARLKIRTIPSPTYINLFRALGAAPTPMNFGELYTALQQGVVDGAENDILTYQNSKHSEVAKRLAITKHMMLVNTFFVSQKIWETLPADMQAIVTAASLEARKAAMDDSDHRQATATSDLKAAGVTVTEPSLKPFAAAAEQTLPWFKERFGSAAVDAIVRANG